MEVLVNRFKELSKNQDVLNYISWRDWWKDSGMVDNSLFSSELTLEYEEIENKLKNLIIEEINKRSLHIFQSLNLRDFNLFNIQSQLEDLAFLHWNSRTQIEILRDKLLHWQYHYYGNYYKEVAKYKELQEIDKTRKIYKEELKQLIIGDFTERFIEELNSNKLQEILRKLNDYYYTYSKDRAKEYFAVRNTETIERDTFGYVDIDAYENCFFTSLQQAIEFIQSASKAETIELYLIFLRKKMVESDTKEYSGNINDDLYHYASSLFDNRNQTKIEEDNFKLIKLKTYLNWRNSAINQIEIEYPEKFEDDELDEEDDDYNDYDGGKISDSRYEKYGGYNGYDDDTIDNAFDGDPLNTWNVD